MALSPDIGILLCAFAPFLAAIIAPLLTRVTNWAAVVLAIVPAGICWYFSGFIEPVMASDVIVVGIDWIPALGIRLSFLVDGLSLTFALLISGIGALILIYSGTYMRGHVHHGRFLGFMLLFMGAMMGLVLSDNLVALCAFWELTSVSSFLLIGVDHTRQAARRAAFQALVVTNIGGLALLAGAVVLQQVAGSWELSEVRALGGAVKESAAYGLILLMILLAAFTKSAQVPLHFWLPNAMQAPTPVSAYLHSATMVQAGVYLLARMFPVLGGTPGWTIALSTAGAVTLLWGSVAALRQSDLKQMLAQTTVAALGMLVLLLGIGTAYSITAAIVYFVAHAFYKAALFLIAGLVEHETGTRDLTALGGLRDRMAVTFIAAVAAAVSMLGLPPALGFLAKEATYAAVIGGDWQTIAALLVLVVGNAVMGGVALAIALRPFMGVLMVTPKAPHEGPVAMLFGPLVLGALGFAAGFLTLWFADAIAYPAAAAILGTAETAHLHAGIHPESPAFWLSLVTWALAGVIFWRIDAIRGVLRRSEARFGWTFDRGFDAVMAGLIGLAGETTRQLHHGRLELYLVVVFLMFALALYVPLLTGGFPAVPAVPELTFYEWGAVALAAVGVLTVFLARVRLFAIIALGIQGLAVAILYLLFGAPDLSFTQFMVEIISVVILALVMTRLRLEAEDPRQFEDLIRDGGLALLCGTGIVFVLLRVLEGTFDPRLSEFFEATSVTLAHGRNIVNVILVDYRGVDTLGEISVVMAAGIAILALIRRQAKSPPAPKRQRRAKVAPAAGEAA